MPWSERFATWDWSDLIAPAIELAERGLRVDWYSSLKIASAARDLSRFPSSKALFLPDGQAPVGEWGGPLPVIDLKALQQHAEATGSRRCRIILSGVACRGYRQGCVFARYATRRR